jgi:hypothetical protein
MKKNITDTFRRELATTIANGLAQNGEDIGFTASNTFNYPCLIEGEEAWVEITVKIPTGTKDEPYDGYGRREDYLQKVTAKAEKAKTAAEAKAKKIAKDKKVRAEKAEKEKGE